jgi:hypothetical protein
VKDKLVRVSKPRLCNCDEASCLFVCLFFCLFLFVCGRMAGVPAGKSETGGLFIIIDCTKQLISHSKMYL